MTCHPSSFQVSELSSSVTRKYCFPTSFDKATAVKYRSPQLQLKCAQGPYIYMYMNINAAIRINTNRARASRVTEFSIEGKAYKDNGEPIGTAPDRLAGTAVDSVISWKSLSLTFLAFGILVWCCHCLLIWLALVIFESWQPFLLPAVCLDVFFSLTILSFDILVWWCHFLSIRFALVISESWQPLSCWQLKSLGPDTLCSPDTLTAVSLLFPTFFSSLLSSFPDTLQLSTLHHISAVFASLLSVLAPLFSSHLCSLHTLFLHIATL